MSAANPMWTYLRTMRFAPSASSAELKRGNSCSALHAGAHDEGERRELDARRLRLVLQARAHFLELGDVRLIELRDVRDVDPAGLQARTGDALDARQRLGSPSARTAQSPLPARRATPPGGCRSGTRRGACGKCAPDERLDVIVGDPVLEAVARHQRQIHAQLAGELRTEGPACARENPGSSMGARSLR